MWHNSTQPGSHTSRWQAPITCMKQNKLFVFVLIFASFAFGALVVGLSVGLSIRVTTTVPSEGS